VDEEDEKPLDKRRVAAALIALFGALLLPFSVVALLQLRWHIVVFVILFVLGMAGLFLGLYILVKTKPEAPKGEEYDEEVPHSDVDFDDWAKTRSVNTYKSERPDPSQYKAKKQYKAFPVKDTSGDAKEDG